MPSAVIVRADDELNPLLPHPIEIAILLVSLLMVAAIVLLVVRLVRR